MRKDLFRKVSSLVLVSAVWLSTGSMIPVFAQTTSDTSKDDTKNSKKDKKAKDQTQTDTQTPAKSSNGLSVNEDPAMIGKRNINGGSDKFFGWLGGSKEKEAQVGRQLAMEVEQQVKLIDDPVVTEYINRIGQNIVLHSDAKVPFTIKVVDTDEVNAFALPGGYFYVNRGLIIAADNESELAGVMAHEIAHVAARHAMENQGKATALNYGMLAGIIFGGGILSTVLQNGGGILGTLGMLKFSRNAEEEADRLGVQYLYASGYDPTGLATMFEKLASQNKKKPGTLSKMFASHPEPENRRETSLALVARFPERDEYIISTSEFQRVKARLLKFTNARATTTIDIDDSQPGKPTLKRRAPEAEDPSSTDSSKGSSSSSDKQNDKQDGPPQLKRRGEEPTTAPTPAPSPSPEK